MGGAWKVVAVLVAWGCAPASDEEAAGGHVFDDRPPRISSEPPPGEGVPDDAPPDGEEPDGGDDTTEAEEPLPPIPDEGCIPDVLAPPVVTPRSDWPETCDELIPVRAAAFVPGQPFGYTEPLPCDPAAGPLPDPRSACSARHLTPEGVLKWERAIPATAVAPRIPPVFKDWTLVELPHGDGVFQRTRFYCSGRPAWNDVRVPYLDEPLRCAYDVDASGQIVAARFASVSTAGPHHCDAAHYAYDAEGRIRAMHFDSAAIHSGSRTFYFDAAGTEFGFSAYQYSQQRFAECTVATEDPSRRVTWYRHENGDVFLTHSATERETGPLGEVVLTRTTWWSGDDWSGTWRSSTRRQYACDGGLILDERDNDADGDRDEHTTWVLQSDGTVRETRFKNEKVVEYIDYRFECAD